MAPSPSDPSQLSSRMAQDPSKSQLPGLTGFNPDNLQPWFVQVVVSMEVLAIASIVLRLVSRRVRKQELWWDDRMILFSMFWNFLVVGFCFAMYSTGMGIHADKVNPKDIVMMAKWLLVAEVLYAWNLGWTKLSVLLMYTRIFHTPFFKRMAWAVGAFVMAWVVCITFLFIFICVPVEKLWYSDTPGHCINQVGTWIANAASTLFTDLVILLMPIPQIWKLRLRTTEKLGVTFAFGLGFFVVFASAYRTSVLFTYTNSDPTYTLAPTVGWTAIEMSAGIVSANLPTLLPAIRYFAQKIGIKGSLFSPTQPVSSGADASKGNKSIKSTVLSQKTNANEIAGVDGGSRVGDRGFYRLEDDTESDGSFIAMSDTTDAENDRNGMKLRPDMKGFKHAVNSYRIEGDSVETKDAIPLQGIVVRKDFEQSSRRK